MEKEKKHILPESKAAFNRVTGAAKWVASGLVWPTKKYQLRALLTCVLAVGPFSGMLFPTIEDELNKEGVDEQVLTDLGVKEGKSIYVRKFNAVGYGHMALSKPNVIAMALFANKIKEVKAFVEYFDERRIESWLNPVVGCRVTVPASKNNTWKVAGFTAQEEYLRTLFHEIRHCAQNHRKLSAYMKEIDADYHATLQLSKRSDDPDDFTQRMVYVEAFSTAKTGHNSALYLDAKFNGTQVPTEQEMKEANQVLSDVLGSGTTTLSDDQPWYVHRRVELLLNAMQALYPDNIKILPSDPSPRLPSSHPSHSK